jgi:hypothetical protein
VGWAALIGSGVLWWLSIHALQRWQVLRDDEGTESWSVKAGADGLLACYVFLALMFASALACATYGLHSVGRSRSNHEG